MQSYEQTFVNDSSGTQGRTNVILSPQNDYLRQFEKGGQ
jgi:hypothetical protein